MPIASALSILSAPLSPPLWHSQRPEACEEADKAGSLVPPAALHPHAASCPQSGTGLLLCVVSAMPRALCHGWDPGFGKNYMVFVSKVKVKTLTQVLAVNVRARGDQTQTPATRL